MRPAARKDWYVDCNWKVYVDNYLEGYQSPSCTPRCTASWTTPVPDGDARALLIQHAPLRPRPRASPRPKTRGRRAVLLLFPNLMLNVYADNYSTNLIVPVGPERTLTVFEWYFRDPTPKRQPPPRETVAFSDEIQLEDSTHLRGRPARPPLARLPQRPLLRTTRERRPPLPRAAQRIYE